MTKTENQWRDSSLRPFLDSLPKCSYFIKEAKAIRGLPDLVGVFYGIPFYLEIKKSKTCLSHPRTKLQEYHLKKFQEAGAFAEFIYPENAWKLMCYLLLKASERNLLNYGEYSELKKKVDFFFGDVSSKRK